LQERATSSD